LVGAEREFKFAIHEIVRYKCDNVNVMHVKLHAVHSHYAI